MQCFAVFLSKIVYAASHLPPELLRTEHAHLERERSLESTGHVEKRCGNWMGEYAQLHRDIRSGAKPPRYVMVRPVGGLADSLACVGSGFYFALVTRRAFLIDETRETDRFSTMYRSPYVEWSSNLNDIRHMSNFTLTRFRAVFGDPTEKDIWPKGVFSHGDLAELGADAEVVYINSCNAGMVVPLFDNPVYKQQLVNMGLRPETAYGCMYAFLFQVLPATKELLVRELAAMEDPESIKIGIQIRTGDDTMTNQTLEDPTLEEAEEALSPHDVTFQCAKEIESRITMASSEPKKVVWYLLTDSVRLRKSALAIYGTKILTNLEGIKDLKHIRKDRGGGGAAAMMYAAGEHWLYSLADYHVFGHGGFGRSAAVASLKWGYHNVLVSGCKPVSVQDLATIAPYI